MDLSKHPIIKLIMGCFDRLIILIQQYAHTPQINQQIPHKKTLPVLGCDILNEAFIWTEEETDEIRYF